MHSHALANNPDGETINVLFQLQTSGSMNTETSSAGGVP